jgi:ATP phosphoribosyltransferase regulatory subunit
MNLQPTASDLGLVDLFERRGCVRIEPSILQPADLFLDLSGEDIRRRLFLVSDADGRELCLRPEYTIPVCRAHIEAGQKAGAYCYLGPVFRQRTAEPAEFLQAGFESIGRDDVAVADAEMLRLALDGVALYGVAAPSVRVGDMALLGTLLGVLQVAPSAQRRLYRALAAGTGIDAALGSSEGRSEGGHAGLVAAIGGQDASAARAFVEDVIAIAGITSVGGRSAGEIADRFLRRSSEPAGGMSERSRATLRAYLGTGGRLDHALPKVREALGEAGPEMTRALDAFARRVDELARIGLDPSGLAFSADFVRNLDYYTGFVFEIAAEAGSFLPPKRLLAGGGRYDGLLAHLGAPSVPAIGCSFWLERLKGDTR